MLLARAACLFDAIGRGDLRGHSDDAVSHSRRPSCACLTHSRLRVFYALAVCMTGGNIVEPRRRAAAGGCSTSSSVQARRELKLWQPAAARKARGARPRAATAAAAAAVRLPGGRVVALRAQAVGQARRPAAVRGPCLNYWVDWASWEPKRGARGAVEHVLSQK